MPMFDTENDSRDSAPRQTASDFPQIVPERANQRHSDRPLKLNIFDVFADHLPVCQIKSLQPFAHRFASAIGTIEARRKSLQTGIHTPLYQF